MYKDLDNAIRAYLKVRKVAEVKRETSSYIGEAEDPDEENGKDNKFIVFGGKTDVQSAFRLIPLKPDSWKWLIMKAEDPQTGKIQYFADKCLPFGASISCAIFQKFSDALQFLIEKKTGSIPNSVTNYLDDFLFLACTML